MSTKPFVWSVTAVACATALAAMIMASQGAHGEFPATTTTAATDQPVPPSDIYPEWTHFYLWEGHLTVVDGRDALTAIMNCKVIARGTQQDVWITNTLRDGEVLVQGAIENRSDEAVELLTSDGRWLTLEPGMRAVVSTKALYGFDPALQAAPRPNVCICKCGNGHIHLRIPFQPAANGCASYNGLGPCIDPTDHSTSTMSECVPGYGPQMVDQIEIDAPN